MTSSPSIYWVGAGMSAAAAVIRAILPETEAFVKLRESMQSSVRPLISIVDNPRHPEEWLDRFARNAVVPQNV